MEQLQAITAKKAIAASAFLTASLGYLLNNKTGFTTDLSAVRSERIAASIFDAHVARLGTHASLYHLLELADPRADALWFEGKTWSYSALKNEVDSMALGLRSLGVKDGAYVAVFMPNCPEMVIVIYALTKIGAVPALINAALREETLLHCVQLPGANLILTTPDLSSFAASAAKSLGGSIRTVALNLGSFPSLHALPEDVATFQQQNTTEAEPIISPPRTLASPAALVYTSGTTGKPKACSVKFALVAAVSCPSVADTQNPKKYLPVRTYSCMPLFHGTTLFTGLCYSVGTSGCFCLSRKFSARTFWKEVYFSRATKILYVGELCRFLLATPRGDWDTRHSVLVAHGNGLQRDVWVAFQKRFAVPEIREFYRSTEGLVKYDNRHRGEAGGAGKVTFAGSLKRRLEKDQFIVKFDYESEAPYRNGQGFCVLAPVGEPGEAIARVKSVAMYPNYHGNPAATEAKIIRNVFEEGDAFQKSGDLLVQEASGWVRFVDRIGDTFRWKGENVSAGEIRSYISELLEVEDVVVVGKRLPAYDGQAGAAAISLGKTSKEVEKKFVESLYGNLKRKGVPAYAFPRLVVITDDIKVGDTFKHAKHIVKALEWKPDGVNSNKYWLDGKQYIQLQEEHWGRIESGRAKL